MKKTSILLIKLALAVQFLALLSVPVLVAANDAPRAMWMAEWVPALSETRTSLGEGRVESNGRTIGVLRLRDGKVSFVEQVGQVDWELDLASVARVTAASGRLAISSVRGEEFVVAVMEQNMMPMSPKKVVATIERAIQVVTASSR